MISDAMKVRLRRGDRGVLEARLRAATTEQRQLLRIAAPSHHSNAPFGSDCQSILSKIVALGQAVNQRYCTSRLAEMNIFHHELVSPSAGYRFGPYAKCPVRVKLRSGDAYAPRADRL